MKLIRKLFSPIDIYAITQNGVFSSFLVNTSGFVVMGNHSIEGMILGPLQVHPSLINKLKKKFTPQSGGSGYLKSGNYISTIDYSSTIGKPNYQTIISRPSVQVPLPSSLTMQEQADKDFDEMCELHDEMLDKGLIDR